eukprot:CAMPEP_0206125992 /NCGR_PEP_ID=MMETSP1472-20131121/20004_1 /ASSEMBLY_ACC=CAM_ASM_001108 /TAXON_ID=41880 /ORGANISM="Pycnococcus provasolii, Strain RCC251" /LENGTH=63 /DNA_ID=CAMNT_0053516971 /DNA_START=28 /DNA_END=216 /DNA_ORIENTATION=+
MYGTFSANGTRRRRATESNAQDDDVACGAHPVPAFQRRNNAGRDVEGAFRRPPASRRYSLGVA